jgi:hypothetical protein
MPAQISGDGLDVAFNVKYLVGMTESDSDLTERGANAAQHRATLVHAMSLP